MSKWKVYISSTFKDLREFRSGIITLFQNQLNNNFELCKIMERMFDDGTYTPFVKECQEQVEDCDIYIIILGNRVGTFPPEESRTYTEIEFDTALKKEKNIFCLRLESFNENEIDNPVKHKEILNKFTGRSLHTFKDSKELENILYKCLFQFATQFPVNINNPYKGLAAFNVEDGNYFFGRTIEIEECIKKIIINNENTFISIIGNSGIGKTSFVQAGILFRLKHTPELGFSDYQQVIVTPGNEPFSNLKYQLHLKGIVLEDVIKSRCLGNTILFFNQFEEIISQCNSEESVKERKQLFEFLDALSSNKTAKSKLVIITTIRSDFVSPLANFDFIKNYQIFFPLSSLDYSVHASNWEKSIEEIITQPAVKNSVVIEKELVAQLTNEIKEVEGSLPILQFTLKQIWNNETINDRKIISSEYNNLSRGKGISGIIEIHAEQVVKRITQNGNCKEKEAVLKSIFVTLVEVNENRLDLKRTVKKGELLKKLEVYPIETVIAVFEDLVNEESRLLIVAETNDKSINVDIIHEVLIRKWERLRVWINERREALEYQTRVRTDINDFNKGEEKLYNGKKLKLTLLWKVKNPDLSSDEINAFIKRSQSKAKIRACKIIGIPLIILLLSFVLYKPILGWKFVHDIKNYPSLQQQLEAAGGDLDLFKTLTIDASNYSILNKKIGEFKRLENLVIENLILKDLTFLNKLSSLHSLKIIKNTNLASLQGIEKLTSLRSLEINNNKNLASLQGVEKLTALDSLIITFNENLTNLKGIENLPALHSLVISQNGRLINLKEIEKFTTLHSLKISHENLTNLQGIENLTALNSLEITENDSLTSLTGIENLTALNSLIISANISLINSRGIEKLTALHSLEIYQNDSLINLQGIEKLTALHSLKIFQNNNLINLQGIEKLTALHSLIIAYNYKLANLKGIEKLTTLRSLEINNNGSLTSLQEIEKLTNLYSLVISRNKYLINLQGIEKLTSLYSLALVDNYKLTSLQGIEKLTTLRSLEISQNDLLANLQGIEKLTYLHSLKISQNDLLANLQGIENLTAIHSLKIAHNDSLTSLNGIESLITLYSLEISDNNNLASLQKIEKLINLHSLIIAYNHRLTSLQGIEKLTALHSLNIFMNRNLTSLQGIEKLTALDSLEISDNENLTSLQGIEKLIDLRVLTIEGVDQLNYNAIYELSKLEELHIQNGYVIDYERLENKTPRVKLIRPKIENDTDDIQY